MKVRYKSRPRLRYIPFRKRDVVEMCLVSGGFDSRAQMKFREFCHVLQSVYHFEYHETLETLKDSYAPMNPDRDTRLIGIYRAGGETRFVDGLNAVLDKANYDKFSDDDLERAISDSTLFNLRLRIDFSDFEEVLLYTRGESVREEERRRFFGLIRDKLTFSVFDRVVIYVQFAHTLDAARSSNKPGSTMLKLFQNVPRDDIEMLFPNTRISMRMVDKLMIGVPAVLGGGVMLTTKVGTSLLLLGTLLGYYLGLSTYPVELDATSLLLFLSTAGGLGAYIWKQFVNFKNRKLTLMQSLMENLYFRNLDNNAGVFHRLIDDAEEEECKEAIVAYYFLLTRPEENTPEKLDRVIEAWFTDRWDSKVDFEVMDALDKLKELGLATATDDTYAAVSLASACDILDQRWDSYFAFDSRGTENSV